MRAPPSIASSLTTAAQSSACTIKQKAAWTHLLVEGATDTHTDRQTQLRSKLLLYPSQRHFKLEDGRLTSISSWLHAATSPKLWWIGHWIDRSRLVSCLFVCLNRLSDWQASAAASAGDGRRSRDAIDARFMARNKTFGPIRSRHAPAGGRRREDLNLKYYLLKKKLQIKFNN